MWCPFDNLSRFQYSNFKLHREAHYHDRANKFNDRNFLTKVDKIMAPYSSTKTLSAQYRSESKSSVRTLSRGGVDSKSQVNKMEADGTLIDNAEREKGDREHEDAVDMLERLSKDYSTYLEIDASKDKSKFGETIEDMLTKLDEFGSLVDMIRSDSTLCLTSTLPKVQEKQAEIQAIFDKIDRLEAFVSVVRENIATMEDCVNKAEDEMGSFSGLKKMLSSFVSPKRSQTKDNRTVSFTPPHIFRTEEYFPQQPAQKHEPGETTDFSKTKSNVTPEESTAS
ncbi:biogenesis of lysosome-related organelles complex 1 subunit 4-like [Ylistrum balloti]|uniref:biogenesis of lysosome-related organelles complex 1 subunit 4-like n=1 Tax=Ylistrum balloti TaxID=509963 RepID=UPI002905CF03|nr:biogenesis of lysosome-related organelles complex 1 subunit 4-like [Ylistrum balloti]